MLRLNIPITKVDAARRLVTGVATAEVADRAGEICDYATTKPLYEKWSEAIATSSGGKSLGNLRAMHGHVAAGKVTALSFNDAAKQIEICAKVVDDALDGVALAASPAPGQGGYVVDAPDVAPPGTMQRLAYRCGLFPKGRQNIVVAYRAGYEVRGETAVVPAAVPYVVTAQAPFGAWCLDTGVTGASGGYSVAGGVYTFTALAAGQSIALSYGYVPADLAQAACEWIADRYAARTRIGQSAKTLGGQETTSFIVKAMPDVVSRLLQLYRRIAR